MSTEEVKAEDNGVSLMTSDSLPPIEETWVQFQRICASSLFARSANHQVLLRELIRRLYAGSDDFAAKNLADEVFGRDTSIAKVEGRAVREKLITYYSEDGHDEPIVIELPRRTFRPKIFKAVGGVSYIGRRMWFKAYDRLEMPHQGGLNAALHFVMQALESDPDHPRLLGLKALIHVLRTLYGEDPRIEFEAAEYLVRDAYARHAVGPEAALAKASLHASRCQWRQADVTFKAAFSLPEGAGWRPRNSNPWHIVFLASQLRFEEAIEILNHMRQVPTMQAPDVDAECAMLHIMAGNLKEAGQIIEDSASFFEQQGPAFFLTPVLAVLFAAQGDFARALEEIKDVTGELTHSIIGSAQPGLYALFAGLSGKVEEAKEFYSDLRGHRSSYGDLAARNAPRYRIPAFHLALAALGAGRTDEAVKWLDTSFTQEREPLTLWTHILPFFQPLRTHSGFRALVTGKMKLKLRI